MVGISTSSSGDRAAETYPASGSNNGKETSMNGDGVLTGTVVTRDGVPGAACRNATVSPYISIRDQPFGMAAGCVKPAAILCGRS